MPSSCCWAPVRDPGGTGEWLCTECYEYCADEPEDEKWYSYVDDPDNAYDIYLDSVLESK